MASRSSSLIRALKRQLRLKVLVQISAVLELSLLPRRTDVIALISTRPLVYLVFRDRLRFSSTNKVTFPSSQSPYFSWSVPLFVAFFWYFFFMRTAPASNRNKSIKGACEQQNIPLWVIPCSSLCLWTVTCNVIAIHMVDRSIRKGHTFEFLYLCMRYVRSMNHTPNNISFQSS